MIEKIAPITEDKKSNSYLSPPLTLDY